ncbi:MAG: zinc-binding dehydrogenase [Oscillospiraceae bacterium]|nr:zinc-binding dehydrogenase [Oscillospiraceae bacterium]
MKALVLSDFGKIGVQELPEPEATGKLVKLKVIYAGVCGTDIHAVEGGYSRTKVPVVLGHEVAGIVVETGSQVTKVKVGDRVTSETTFSSCGECVYCKNNELNLCPERVGIGTNQNGAYEEYMLSHEDRLHILPENVSLMDAAITEPVACGVHACMETVKVKKGEWVCIFGAGAIGVLLAEVVKSQGAGVILAGLSADADILAQEKEFGIDVVVDQENEDLCQKVKALTGGYGVDYVFECSGAIPALLKSLEIVRKKGKIIQLGVYPTEKVALPMEVFLQNEIQLVGSRSQRPSSWPIALELMSSGKVMPAHVIDKVYPLEQWHSAFYNKYGGKKNIIQCSEHEKA